MKTVFGGFEKRLKFTKFGHRTHKFFTKLFYLPTVGYS